MNDIGNLESHVFLRNSLSDWGRAAPSHIPELHRRPNNEGLRLLLNLPLTSCGNNERFLHSLFSVFGTGILSSYLGISEMRSFDSSSARTMFGPIHMSVPRHRPGHNLETSHVSVICRLIGASVKQVFRASMLNGQLSRSSGCNLREGWSKT